MMTNSAAAVLVLVLMFQVKHFICDGPLQTKTMVLSKSNYGDGQGVLHAANHGLGTLIVVALFGLGWPVALVLAALDGVIHYHVDFTKENIVKRAGWTVQNREFWWALTADQFLHNLTYIALMALAIWVF